MAYDVTASLQRIHTYVQGSGHVQASQIGEPTGPPEADGITAAIIMNSQRVVDLYADGATRESHIVVVRLYRNMLAEVAGGNSVEAELAYATSQIEADLVGDADLGGEVMTVDVGGILGQTLAAVWGYEDISHVMHRTVDITVPLYVNNSATVTP